MKTFEISEVVAQKILNYLVEQPFKEVALLVNELSQLKLIKEDSTISDTSSK